MHRLCWMLSIVLMLVAFSACTPADVPIHIRVVDADTGQALNCEMTVAPTDGQLDSIKGVLTDGELSLSLPPGSYHVVVSAQGYHPSDDSFQAVDLVAPVERVIRLQRVEVRVAVADAETGAPLPHVVVAYGDLIAVTDGDGQTSVPWVPLLPKQDIVLHEPRYETMTIALSDVNGENLDVDAQLAPRVIEGQVVDGETATPLVDAEVQCGHQAALTDAAGRFRLSRVAPDDTLQVSAAGYVTVDDASQDHDLVVAMDALLQSVVVADASSDEPLSGVTVSSTRDTVTTDASGAATLRIFDEDTLDLVLSGYAPLSAEVMSSSEPLHLSMMPSRLNLHYRHAITGLPITLATTLLYFGDEVVVRHPDAAGDLVVDDVTGLDRIMIKAPSYRRVEMPVTKAGEIAVALEPFDVRAVYIPFGALTLPDRIAGILDMIDASPELNGIVVDVKSDRARLAWPSAHPLAVEMDAYQTDIMDLTELLAECERRGIYTIARMVVFKDDLLAQARPEWAVMRDTGKVYLDNEDLRWVDPFRQEVRDYSISLALEIAAMGWDEVQFDYLRFPSDGGTKGLVYQQESVFETRTVAMAEFVAQAHDALEPTPAFFSADIFGLTVWVDPARDMGIGQRVDDIAPFVDYLSPMLYPTTFGEGNLGYDDPGSLPYEVIYHSVLKTLKRTHTPVRPWLQAYSIGDYEYGLWELLAQKKGAVDADSHGWIYWNAAGKYPAETFQPDAYDLVDPMPEPPAKD